MKYGLISFFLCLIMGLCVYADQVIYIDLANFIPKESQFGVEVHGNEWVEVADPSALDGTAFGGPGDNERNGANPIGAPFLVIKFPVKVENREAKAVGKEWIPWARLRIPAEPNSFWWQVSADKVNWEPWDNTNANRWNDDNMNGSDVWYWQDNVTGNDGGIDAEISPGANYIRIGIRESDPVTFPLIDVVCLRNDGEPPLDEEARDYLETVGPRRPVQKLALAWRTWGAIKHSF